LNRAVSDAVRIPVIASGDVLSASLAREAFFITGCAGVAVARGALGNPWIFREIKAFFEKGIVLPRPEYSEIVETMLSHLNYCVDFYGEKFGVMIFRKFFTWYTKGMRKVRPVREVAYRSKRKDEMVKLIKELLFNHCSV
jgi:tRNA-dihydrouridine synthase